MEARRSLTQSTFTHYVGVTGSGSHGRFQCRRMEFDLPPERKWEECPGLAVDVRRRLDEPGCVATEIDTGEAEPNTFLDSVRRAMHGATRSHIRAQRPTLSPDGAPLRRRLRRVPTGGKAPGCAFRARGGTDRDHRRPDGRRQHRVPVVVRPRRPNRVASVFRVSPRSFLRLAFEWDRPGKGSSPVSPLFNKEDV